MKFNNKTVFVVLFAILYFAVCSVSTIHAISFFGLANSPILGTILAITFEIGQAAVLFNLLTNPSQRKRFMPWALMCILTLVQILGNIFSSYKYLITNSTENLRYFKEPIFTWTDLPDQQCNVIITYIVGAILPIVALCLTEMVVSYLGNEEEEKKSEELSITQQPVEEQIDKEPIITPEMITDVNNKLVKEYEETHKKNEIVETTEANNEDIQLQENNEQKTINEQNVEAHNASDDIDKETQDAVDELLSGVIKQDNIQPSKSSHFINI